MKTTKDWLSYFVGLVVVSQAYSYQLGGTLRTLKVSNNGEYFPKETDIGIKSGVYFQPDYILSPYFELVHLGETYEVLPIVGLRIRPALQRLWVRPRIGVNLYPLSFQLELESTFKSFHVGAYFEILNWGDSGWLSQGVKVGYNIPVPIK